MEPRVTYFYYKLCLLCCAPLRDFGHSYILSYWKLQLGYGVTVNIAASHAAARGSIPRIRIMFCFACKLVGPSPVHSQLLE